MLTQIENNSLRTFIPPEFRPRVKGEKLQESPRQEMSVEASSKKRVEAIVCIHMREDNSQAKVLNTHKGTRIFFLEHDSLGRSWNFSFYQGQLLFFHDQYEIDPVGVYNRPYAPDSNHPAFYLFNNLLRALECWDGNLLGPTTKHFQNSSKAYQMTETIRNCVKRCSTGKIRFPVSYYVKGKKALEKVIQVDHDLIVKSGSGIRSEVATCSQFSQWDQRNISSIPTLFQEKSSGQDIRVHWIKGKSFQAILKQKVGSIDCRYSKIKTPFERYPFSEEIHQFCAELAKCENLDLIGVDFMSENERYVCLESNPNPGWAAFHRFAGDEEALATEIIKKLSSKR